MPDETPVRADTSLRHALSRLEGAKTSRGTGLGRTRRSETDRPLSIHQTLARDLGRAILSGRYGPGDTLGKEVERSEELGVSRTAYREAVRILSAKGLVESRRKAGTYVTPRSRWNLLDLDVLAWNFSGDAPDDFIHELFELRYIFEPSVAYLAARRRDDADLARMRTALDTMSAHGLETSAGQAAEHDFHYALIAAAGNSALASLAVPIGAAIQWTTIFKQRQGMTWRDPVPEHEAVFAAVSGQDTERAKNEMRRLLRLAVADMGLGPRPF